MIAEARIMRRAFQTVGVLLGAVAALALGGCLRTSARAVGPVESGGSIAPSFEVDGKPLCFAGANNYYAIFKPKPVVDDLFAAAQALGLRVMRVWGMLDRGALDGSVPDRDGRGDKEGVYFQYWDPERARPAYNDGASGLERLDYVIASAAQHDIFLIIVLVNNWSPFGGIDQYLTWYGRNFHDEFFTAPDVRAAYRDWATHVVTRINRVTGRAYRDDPTIMAWELANEPRCKGGGGRDRDNGWSRRTITDWADEMSAHVKSLDPEHLVSVGDEGFLNRNGEHFAYRAGDGVDHEALTRLPGIDFGTFHLYPEAWQMSGRLAERYIEDQLQLAAQIGKPVILEEYGREVSRASGHRGPISAGLEQRLPAYARWNELLLARGGSGALPWMLAGLDGNGQRYPDYDRFAFYRDDETGGLTARYARRFETEAAACAAPTPAIRPPSPFVRARKRAERSARGWREETALTAVRAALE